MLTRHADGEHVVWQAVLNGEMCEWATTGATVPTERGIADGRMVGVELLDAAGKRLAFSVRTA